jgi:Protein of unknown function (DUF3568)
MRIRQLCLVGASTGMLTVANGCATTSRISPPQGQQPASSASTAGRLDQSVRYSGGRAMQDFKIPVATVTPAILEAMEDLSISVTRRGQDGPVSQIEGRTADNRLVAVTLRPQKPITHVSCRVGWFGDEPYSRALLRRIGVRLGTLPPEAIPEKPPSAPAANPYFSRDAIPDSEMMQDALEAPYRSRPDI